MVRKSMTGLSSGQRMGIGIGAGIAAIVFIGSVFFWLWRHLRSEYTMQIEEAFAMELTLVATALNWYIL
jgi:hypothetical protein